MSYRVRSVDEIAQRANISNTVIDNTDASELVFYLDGKRVIDSDDLYDFFKFCGKPNWYNNYPRSLSKLENELTSHNGRRLAVEIRNELGMDSWGNEARVTPADGNDFYVQFIDELTTERLATLNKYGHIVKIDAGVTVNTITLKYVSPIKINS